jgi:hypothetical protein
MSTKPTATNGLPTDPSLPGTAFEHRQDFPKGESTTPDQSKSLPLDSARQSLLDDILALYSCQATVERIKRYTPDAVYHDPFAYADNRYNIAGQWFGLTKLFQSGKSKSHQVIKNDRDLIQFKNSMTWTFAVIGKDVSMDSIVSLSLDPATVDSDFIRVKYHKDQAREEDYSNSGLGPALKKFQADQTARFIGVEEMKEFEEDRKYGGQKEKKAEEERAT